MNKFMDKTIKFLVNFLFLFFLFSSSVVFAHKSASHAPGSHFDPVKCIPESERTPGQLKWDIDVNKMFHRLSKRQQDCAIFRIQQLEQSQQESQDLIKQIKEENEKMLKSLQNSALCSDISFNHKSKSKAKLFSKPDTKSNKVSDIKEGASLLYVSDPLQQKLVICIT